MGMEIQRTQKNVRYFETKFSKIKFFQFMKGVFVGSGSEGLQNQEVCDSILYLCEKGDTTQINVIYVGTATYDLDSPMVNQTIRLKEAGCNIIKLSVTEPDKRPSFSELEKLVTEVADIVSEAKNIMAKSTEINIAPLIFFVFCCSLHSFCSASLGKDNNLWRKHPVCH